MIDLMRFEVVFFLDRDATILFLMWEKKKKYEELYSLVEILVFTHKRHFKSGECSRWFIVPVFEWLNALGG